jgi:outer membrane protein assembly factor BamB
MKMETIAGGVTAAVSLVVAAIALGWWFTSSSAVEIDKRISRSLVPGETPGDDGIIVDIKGQHLTFDGQASALEGRWPRFRGEQFDNISRATGSLADSWPSEGPPTLWSVDLGEGYAGAAIRNGCVYVLDYDNEQDGDALRCFSLDDGREIWRRWYKVRVKRNHGMSRTVPAVTDKYVVTIGPKCHVMCVDARTGDFLWGMDLAKEYGTEVPMWYTGQCPLIDGDRAIIATGGKALLIAVDCATGKVVWESPNPHEWKMSHSCIMPMELSGIGMYVYAAIGGVAGVSSGESDAGTILWETTAWNHSVVSPSPLIMGDGRIFLTAGYGAGSMMLRVTEEHGNFSAESVYALTKKEFACEQHTPILYDEHLFTVMPADGGALKRQLVCADSEGKTVWTSGKDKRFGLGPFMIADEKMFVLNDNGTLTMVEASTESYRELGSVRVLGGREAWAPMAIAEGRLILRDFKKMICLDVSK